MARVAGSFLVGLADVAAEHGSPSAVATCGLITVRPGATNIVAEEVTLNLDVPSDAGHDAQVMARVVPTGMIFVPSEEGRSHSPVESTPPEMLETGTNVLLHVLAGLPTD